MIVFLILLAAIAPLVVVGPLRDDFVLPKLATTAAFTGLALLWGAVALRRGRSPVGLLPQHLLLPVIAFILVNVLAFFLSSDWRTSLLGEHQRYQGLATTTLYVLLFGVTAAAIRTMRDLRWLLWAVFAGGLGTALYALIQEAGVDWMNSAGQASDRPGSTFGQANVLGAYLGVVISISVFLAVSASKHWQRIALGGAVSAMLLALLFTLSRAAYVAAFVEVVVWALAAALWLGFHRRGKQPRTMRLAAASGGTALATAVLAVTLASLLFVALPQGREALGQAFARVEAVSEYEGEAVGGRLSLWRLALRMTADRPFLGHGQDSFTTLFGIYREQPDLPGIGTRNIAPESAHNLFLDISSGTGIIGLLAFCALAGSVLWHAARRALATSNATEHFALVALVAGVVGNLVALFFGFGEAMTGWLLWLLLGAIVGVLANVSRSRSESEQGPRPRQPAVVLGALSLTLVGAICLSWAATLIAGDLAAGQAERASARGEHTFAARLAGRAVSFNPLQREYLFLQARAEEHTASEFSSLDIGASLRRSISTYETLLQRFEPRAFEVASYATATLELAEWEGTPAEETFGIFERAIELDPYNVVLRSFVADLYEEFGFEDLALIHRTVIYCWSTPCD